jgi:hypothetical protein
MESILTPEILTALVIAALMLNLLFSIWVIVCVRSMGKENQNLNKEMFGLVKRIEGLTSHRRDQVLGQFDKLVEHLSSRIPTMVAAKASERIFETESTILKRLAEIDPELANEEGKEKLDSLIHSMESLEKTVISHTATAVHQVMLENRKSLFEEESASDSLIPQQ